MNPPSEQLIRDYLNRLSLAAKAGLGPGDRQALLDQTRARIDAECGGIAKPTAAQVRRTLAGLGDPLALVEKERSRVAARKAWDADAASRTATDSAPSRSADAGPGLERRQADESRANGGQRQVWPPPATPVVALRPLMPPVILPPATANAQGSAVRLSTTTTPSAPASQPVLAGSQLAAGFAVSAPPVIAGQPLMASESGPGTSLSASNGGWAKPPVSASQVSADQEAKPEPSDPASSSEPAPAGGAGRGEAGNARINGLSARQRSLPPAPASESTAAAQAMPASEGGSDADQLPREPAGRSEPDDQDVPGVEFSVDPADPKVRPNRLIGIVRKVGHTAGKAVRRRLRRFGAALLTIGRRDRLEAVAIILLGIGGAIYQPIWLIGAFVATASKKWDLRDKWLGLALPVLAVLIGTALDLTLGAPLSGYRHYLVEAWVAAGRLSRIAAVLSALFLLWRVYKYQGSPTKRLPPWSPHRKPGR